MQKKNMQKTCIHTYVIRDCGALPQHSYISGHAATLLTFFTRCGESQ
jgi:hypothetical protein